MSKPYRVCGFISSWSSIRFSFLSLLGHSSGRDADLAVGREKKQDLTEKKCPAERGGCAATDPSDSFPNPLFR